jgi:predicted ATP-dependent endonuclease of OLD family
VIDEPEAHLDSSVIANYLVALIKQVKSKRQIIFATHNANFVVNGDAELVHVISMDSEGRSVVKSFTIEDTSARPLLLALEGGEAAFKQREGRYALS